MGDTRPGLNDLPSAWRNGRASDYSDRAAINLWQTAFITKVYGFLQKILPWSIRHPHKNDLWHFVRVITPWWFNWSFFRLIQIKSGSNWLHIDVKLSMSWQRCNNQHTLFSSLESTYIVGNGSPLPQHFMAYRHHKYKQTTIATKRCHLMLYIPSSGHKQIKIYMFLKQQSNFGPKLFQTSRRHHSPITFIDLSGHRSTSTIST